MTKPVVRTRFAPSPTGLMHVGNLRTALFECLIARSLGGQFILRIEDTDQERLVAGAVDIIYSTLREVGIEHDEGPDIGGPYGPYVQSERIPLYRQYAEQLVDAGSAYRCFCSRERLEQLREQAAANNSFGGYDGHCRDLPPAEIEEKLATGVPFVIRQKMPRSGSTTFHDAVYGDITVENNELEDQVLLKSDSFPTYNFANVVDDHLMKITHVVRGSEYLSSTPKYNLLYDAFGWEIPTYVHLPLILGADGQKLSKRHGSTGYHDLVREGYLPEAIVNMIALLGWSAKDTREIFSLAELSKAFTVEGISKSPAIFDYNKLDWFNAEYIKAMPMPELLARARGFLPVAIAGEAVKEELTVEILKPRINRLTEIPERLAFVEELADYPLSLFENKKSKSTLDSAAAVLAVLIPKLAALPAWDRTLLHDTVMAEAVALELKTGTVMWPLRIAASGREVTPGGAIEVLVLLGREESLRRLEIGRQRLADSLSQQPEPQ